MILLLPNKDRSVLKKQDIYSRPSVNYAEESTGTAKKIEYIRFYKVVRDKENDNMTLSSVISARYNSAGDIVGGTYKSRNHSTLVTNNCSSKGTYTLICRRAQDKQLQEIKILFVRWVTFTMPIWKYHVYFKKTKIYV